MCLILRARNDYCVGVYCICTYAALLGVRGLDGACISGTYGSSGPGQSLYQNLSYSLQQMNSIATLLKDLCKALQAASKLSVVLPSIFFGVGCLWLNDTTGCVLSIDSPDIHS